MEEWLFFLLLTLLSILVQGFFSMVEMACVSFNKVRLQYYVSKKYKRAIWLSRLLSNPSILFGTTLIGVNLALQFGSECSRRFYSSLGVSPDWAPLTQIALVCIFAELAPMFAARRFPENVTMLGLPIIYFFSKILAPFVYILGLLCRIINKILRIPASASHILSREELQKSLEAREERKGSSDHEDLETMSANIFSLKNQLARDLMEPLSGLLSLPTTSTIKDLKGKLKESHLPYFLLYEGRATNIVGYALARDLISFADDAHTINHARTPWFVLKSTPLMEIIKEFRVNSQSFAVVLDDAGNPKGVLTLDAIVDEIFCPGEKTLKEGQASKVETQIDRTYSGDKLLSEINAELDINLSGKEAETLEELMEELLNHPPALGDIVYVERFELRVDDAPLIGDLRIHLTTRS